MGCLSPSSHWSPASTESEKLKIESVSAQVLRENWVIMTLPFMEQQAVYDSFDLSLPIYDPANEEGRSVELSVLKCPVDSYNRQPFNGSGSSSTAHWNDNWARGNYAANAALGFMTYQWHTTRSAAFADSLGWTSSRIRGVMGANASIGFAEMRDGSSNTVLLGEVRAGVVAFDCRGTWAMSGAPSSLWAHGYIGDCYGPNCQILASDDIAACPDIVAQFGSQAALAEQTEMPCSLANYPNMQQTARSLHVDGVHVCLADGSVRWLGNFIHVRPSSYTNPSVWDRLMLSADGYPVDAGAF